MSSKRSKLYVWPDGRMIFQSCYSLTPDEIVQCRTLIDGVSKQFKAGGVVVVPSEIEVIVVGRTPVLPATQAMRSDT